MASVHGDPGISRPPDMFGAFPVFSTPVDKGVPPQGAPITVASNDRRSMSRAQRK